MPYAICDFDIGIHHKFNILEKEEMLEEQSGISIQQILKS